jgi:hypothetical protein
MAFKGLFIGIDRYVSAEINWLSCATRDATALHALFNSCVSVPCPEKAITTTSSGLPVANCSKRSRIAATVACPSISNVVSPPRLSAAHDTDPYDLARTSITASA